MICHRQTVTLVTTQGQHKILLTRHAVLWMHYAIPRYIKKHKWYRLKKPNVSNYATIGSIRSIWIPSWQHILTFFHFICIYIYIYIPYPSFYRLVQKELKWEITIIPKPGLRDFRRDSLTVTTMRGDQPVVWSPSKNHSFGRKRKHKTSLHSREIAVASPMTLSCRRNSWVEKHSSFLDNKKSRGY